MSRRNQRKKKKHVLLIIFIIILVFAGGWYLLVSKICDKMNLVPPTQTSEESEKQPYKEKGAVNILLIGSDSREDDEEGRSDAMILLSISDNTKTIQMISLLRDMYVEIPGHDGNRLNAAYAYGGPELLMDTIEQNFDIPVNRYMVVNFEAFANLVDAVGGVELELTNEEVQYVNGYLIEYNMLTERPEGTDYLDPAAAGKLHLNGAQALSYSRNRYIGMDFGRTERQRKVLSEIVKNLPKALITNPVELADGLLPNLTTNLTKQECYLLSLQAGKPFLYNIEQGCVPVEGTYEAANIRGMEVLQIDFDKNKEYLQNCIYDKN